MPQSKIRRYLKHGTLPQLSVFEAAARHGNFTRTAEELFMAQPTVSVHLKKLGETVGLPLFRQSGRKTELTEAGRQLQRACSEIFAAFAKAEEVFAPMRERPPQ